MTKHSPENERIKRQYFAYLKEAKSHGEPTVDAAAKALSRFEEYTKYRDFKSFHHEQAIAFKKHLADLKGQRSGEKLSKATLHATLISAQTFLSVAIRPTRLQVAFSILRRGVFQPVRKGHADCHGATRKASADAGAGAASN